MPATWNETALRPESPRARLLAVRSADLSGESEGIASSERVQAGTRGHRQRRRGKSLGQGGPLWMVQGIAATRVTVVEAVCPRPSVSTSSTPRYPR
jgi:hypothetical protein